MKYIKYCDEYINLFFEKKEKYYHILDNHKKYDDYIKEDNIFFHEKRNTSENKRHPQKFPKHLPFLFILEFFDNKTKDNNKRRRS